MLNLSKEFKQQLETASNNEPFHPARMEQLKTGLNLQIAKLGEDAVGQDIVELAKFLNSVEGSALDFAMQGSTFGFSDEIMGNFSSLPSNFATDVERYAMEVYRQQKPIRAAFSEVGGAILPSFVKVTGLKKGSYISPQTARQVDRVIVKTKDFFNPTLTSATRSGVYGTVYGLGKEEGTAKERFGKFQPYVNGLISAAVSYPVRVLSRGTNAIID